MIDFELRSSGTDTRMTNCTLQFRRVFRPIIGLKRAKGFLRYGLDYAVPASDPSEKSLCEEGNIIRTAPEGRNLHYRQKSEEVKAKAALLCHLCQIVTSGSKYTRGERMPLWPNFLLPKASHQLCLEIERESSHFIQKNRSTFRSRQETTPLNAFLTRS